MAAFEEDSTFRWGNLSSKSRRARLFRKGHRLCIYCQAELTLETSTLEHLVPRSRGGSDDKSNLTLACFPCNNRKGDMTVSEYQIYRRKRC